MCEHQHMFKENYNITDMGRLLLHGWHDLITSTVVKMAPCIQVGKLVTCQLLDKIIPFLQVDKFASCLHIEYLGPHLQIDKLVH